MKLEEQFFKSLKFKSKFLNQINMVTSGISATAGVFTALVNTFHTYKFNE